MFKWGKFIGASGGELDYKIICDEFTEEDWDCLAKIVIQKMKQEGHIFAYAVGVPSGGIPFADAINRNLDEEGIGAKDKGVVIVCEDIWTTGGSVRRYLDRTPWVKARNPLTWAVFARSDPGYEARALFYTEGAILSLA